MAFQYHNKYYKTPTNSWPRSNFIHIVRANYGEAFENDIRLCVVTKQEN